MPICERDTWRFQYFEAVPCPDSVNVPTDDIDCWAWFPDWRWVYDKLVIARSQGIPCGTHADMPGTFPVFSKPRINLKGMGLGSRVIRSAREFMETRQEDHIWTELLSGPHVSTDVAVVDGTCAWIRHAEGVPWEDGMFKHWIIAREVEPALFETLSQWVGRHMLGYTGMMNFETIGGKIIEAHLRFADQWVDLYGHGWIEALVRLYEHGTWRLDTEQRRTGYSLPLFASHGSVPPYPDVTAQAAIRARPGVSSLQITYHANKSGDAHPMPPGGFRLGIINASDFDAGQAARRQLAACFPSCKLMLPA